MLGRVSDHPRAGRLSASSGAVAALLGRGSIYTVATALQLSAGLIVLPALTRLLPPREVGVVALAVVVQSVLGVVAAAGLPNAIFRVFFKGKEGPRRARLLLRYCLLGAILTAAVAQLTGPLWSRVFTDLGYGVALQLAIWSAVPLAVLMCSQALLRAEDRAGRFVVTMAGATAFAQALGLAVVAGTDMGAAGYVLGLLAGQSVAAGLAAVWAGLGTSPFRGTEGLMTETLRVGFPTVPHSLAIYVLAAGDRVIVEGQLGLGAVGQYQVAYAVGALVLALLTAFNNAWDPIIYGEREERRWATLAETRAVLYQLGGMVSAALAIGAPLALLLAAPGEYDPFGLVPVTSVVVLSAVPMVSYLASAHVLIWEGRTGVMAWSTPLAASVNIGLNLALIPVFGLEGAAVATVLAYGLLALLTRRAARHLALVPASTRALLTAAAWAGTGTTASLVLPADGIWLAVRTLAALCIGAAILRFAASRLRGDLVSERAEDEASAGPALDIATG